MTLQCPEDACFNVCLITYFKKAFHLLIFMNPVSKEEWTVRTGHSETKHETDAKVANSF